MVCLIHRGLESIESIFNVQRYTYPIDIDSALLPILCESWLLAF